MDSPACLVLANYTVLANDTVLVQGTPFTPTDRFARGALAEASAFLARPSALDRRAVSPRGPARIWLHPDLALRLFGREPSHLDFLEIHLGGRPVEVYGETREHPGDLALVCTHSGSYVLVVAPTELSVAEAEIYAHLRSGHDRMAVESATMAARLLGAPAPHLPTAVAA
jgi:hypothetical protein